MIARPRSFERLANTSGAVTHATQSADLNASPPSPTVSPGTASRALASRGTLPESRAEEWANAVTHGLTAIVAAVCLAGLIRQTLGDPLRLTSAIVYGIGLIALFTTSTLYHACRPACTLKRRLRAIDHAAIYVLIAATYTPVLLVTLRGPWGWTLLSIVWPAAILGCVLKLRSVERHEGWSTALYLAMGWIGVIAIKPIVDALPLAGFAWILGGGLLYSAGVAFYAWHRLPFNHAIWHLFVTAAGVCHFVAIRGYVLASPVTS